MAARKSIRIPARAQAGLGPRISSAAGYAHLFEHSPPRRAFQFSLRLIAQPISSGYVCSDAGFTTRLRLLAAGTSGGSNAKGPSLRSNSLGEPRS